MIFKASQEKLINAVLAQKDVLAFVANRSGKSICFSNSCVGS